MNQKERNTKTTQNTYTHIVKQNIGKSKDNTPNITATSINNAEEQTLENKLTRLYPASNNQKRTKTPTPSWSAPRTNQIENKNQKQIQKLKKEIASLKQQSKRSQGIVPAAYIQSSKNVQMVSQMGDQEQEQQNHQKIQPQQCQQPKYQSQKDQQNSIDIVKIITFIKQTMETLNVYNEQLKTQLNIDLTHQEM